MTKKLFIEQNNLKWIQSHQNREIYQERVNALRTNPYNVANLINENIMQQCNGHIYYWATARTVLGFCDFVQKVSISVNYPLNYEIPQNEINPDIMNLYNFDRRIAGFFKERNVESLANSLSPHFLYIQSPDLIDDEHRIGSLLTFHLTFGQSPTDDWFFNIIHRESFNFSEVFSLKNIFKIKKRIFKDICIETGLER